MPNRGYYIQNKDQEKKEEHKNEEPSDTKPQKGEKKKASPPQPSTSANAPIVEPPKIEHKTLIYMKLGLPLQTVRSEALGSYSMAVCIAMGTKDPSDGHGTIG